MVRHIHILHSVLLPNGNKIINYNDYLYYGNPLLKLITQNDINDLNDDINDLNNNIINNHFVFGSRVVSVPLAHNNKPNITISHDNIKYIILFIYPLYSWSAIGQSCCIFGNGINNSDYYIIVTEDIHGDNYKSQFLAGVSYVSFTTKSVKFLLWYGNTEDTDKSFIINYIIFT